VRVLLDTNVLVAAFLTRGQCSELFEHCAREHTLVTSVPLLDEFSQTLTRKLGLSASKAEQAFHLLRSRVQLVDPSPVEAVCRDPSDDVVLATAVSGACGCLVTGDEDLLVLERYRGMPILRPSAFWRYEASRRD
jgi:putative PIN family toxin of toxin-antitoxin system